ncbi:uncharacterized protein LY6E isoform X5 [Callithrix jacchus]|nr:lymphocyte antigen 6E isoform X4 [Callithrix jacchus]
MKTLLVLLAALLGVEREPEEQSVLPEAHHLLRPGQLLPDGDCVCRHRKDRHIWPHPEQVLFPGLSPPRKRQCWHSFHGHPLLPGLPVQFQRGQRRAAGQRHPAGCRTAAEPVACPAAFWPLTAQTLSPAP